MNPPIPQPADPEVATQPGKTRTWWHPLLVNLLRWQLGSHYHVAEEVPVGKKPLQIDILLLLKEAGELPAHTREMLAGLVEHLGEYTLIEFKSPSDTLRAGDLQTLLAYTLLYRAQNEPLLEPSKLHLVVIAPRLTKPYHDEMQILGVMMQAEEPGVWCLQGGVAVHPMWLLETEVLAGVQHPLLTVFSPRFRRETALVYRSLSEVGYNDLVVYMIQQFGQFRKYGKEFAMQHLGVDKELYDVMMETLKQLPLEDRLAIVSLEERLKGVPAEERLKGVPAEERLKGLLAEERLKGLLAEERLKGLPAEEVLKSLPKEEIERLRMLLLQPGTTKADNGN